MTEKPQELEELLQAFEVECKGNDKINLECLPDHIVQQVIVKVYRSGQTTPLCRYLKDENVCSGHLEEERYGVCPYATKD